MFLRRISCNVFELFFLDNESQLYYLKPGVMLFSELFTRAYSCADSLALQYSDEKLRHIIFGFSFERILEYRDNSLYELSVKLYYLFLYERLLWIYSRLRDSENVSELFGKVDNARDEIMIYMHDKNFG